MKDLIIKSDHALSKQEIRIIQKLCPKRKIAIKYRPPFAIVFLISFIVYALIKGFILK